jgi:CrcB protein
MPVVVYVLVGSAVGGAARYLLGTWVQQRLAGAFPIGTLIINVTGSFLLAFLLRYTLDTTAVSAEVRALLTTGFCGGYTTFSTFSYETVKLIEDGDWRRAVLYTVLSVVVSLVAVFAGIALAHQVLDLRRRL